MKGKPTPQNKFKVIVSRVIQCGVREGISMRKQEIEEKGVQYFRYWGMGYYKWKCPNRKVKKEKRRSEEVVYVVNSQKVQQGKILVHFLQKKVQEYSSTWSMPLRSAALEGKGWKMRWKVVMFVEYRECDYKDTKIEENQEQNFISREKLRNIQCKGCLEAWKWRNNEAGSKVKYTKCRRKNIIVEEKISEKKKRNIWCSEYRTERK